MKLEYYVLINEIEEMGADECPIHKERPNGTYLKVLTDKCIHWNSWNASERI